MVTFRTIYAHAARRQGGEQNVEGQLPTDRKPASLRRVSERKMLSSLAKNVFRAGFNWSVVDKRWPGIEDMLGNFEPEHVAALSGRDVDRLLKREGMIRNGAKLSAVVDNARWFLDLRSEGHPYPGFIANWPSTDLIGLWDTMKKQGSRLGGMTSQYHLREVGKDTFMLTRSVRAALVEHGVVSRDPTTKAAMKTVQEAFNAWSGESGRSMAGISKILALSTAA